MYQRTTPAAPDPAGRRAVVDEPRPRDASSWWRRAWRAPLWAHAAVLGAVLVVLVPVVGTDASFSADEGAAIIQARSLADGDGWLVEHPLGAVDPEGDAYPIELGLAGPEGVAPFAKHPVYALALAGAARVGDVAGMVALSIAGALVAAVAAAALGRRLDPQLARPALWTAGLFTPLLFDAYLVMGHTIGAAGCGLATLAVVVGIGRRRPIMFAAAAVAMLGANLVRREALLYAIALAAVGAVVAWRRGRSLAVVAGVAPLIGAAAGALLSARLAAVVVDGAVDTADPADQGWSVGGQVDAFALTWFEPAAGGSGLARALLVAAVLLACLGALDLRLGERRWAAPLFAAGALLVVVRAIAVEPTVVPGLAMAVPFLLPALLLVDRDVLADRTAQVCAGTAALFALAVVATQWSKGGGAEWGGRFFALALPAAVPVLLVAGRRTIGGLDRRAAQVATGAFVAAGLASSVLAVGSLRAAHDGVAELVASIDDAATDVGPSGAFDDQRAVVVATRGLVPRFSWDTFDDHRWLLLDANARDRHEDDLDRYLGRLASEGVDRLLLVTRDWDAERPIVERHYEVADVGAPAEGSTWRFVELERSPT